MPLLFQSEPGLATVLESPFNLPLTIQLDDWGGFTDFKSIMTQIGVTSMGNFQFLHTLRDFIYVYVFGERIGEISIGGIAFADRCRNGTGIGGKTGIEHILGYYDSKRISRTGQPLTLQIGTSSQGRFTGFLTGSKIELIDPQSHMSQFSLRFHKFPRDVTR